VGGEQYLTSILFHSTTRAEMKVVLFLQNQHSLEKEPFTNSILQVFCSSGSLSCRNECVNLTTFCSSNQVWSEKGQSTGELCLVLPNSSDEVDFDNTEILLPSSIVGLQEATEINSSANSCSLKGKYSVGRVVSKNGTASSGR